MEINTSKTTQNIQILKHSHTYKQREHTITLKYIKLDITHPNLRKHSQNTKHPHSSNQVHHSPCINNKHINKSYIKTNPLLQNPQTKVYGIRKTKYITQHTIDRLHTHIKSRNQRLIIHKHLKQKRNNNICTPKPKTLPYPKTHKNGPKSFKINTNQLNHPHIDIHTHTNAYISQYTPSSNLHA